VIGGGLPRLRRWICLMSSWRKRKSLGVSVFGMILVFCGELGV
jgi:hypothetical protein